MASPRPPPTTSADKHEAAPPPLSLHRPQRRLWQRFRSRSCLPSPCLRPKKVLIHSSWTTLVGLFLVRLATADTSSATEARVFAIAGAAGASLPWVLNFLATAAKKPLQISAPHRRSPPTGLLRVVLPSPSLPARSTDERREPPSTITHG